MPTTPTIDRLPPHALEMEQGVISCVLQSPNDCMTECVSKMGNTPEIFYDLRHQTIFSALFEMYECRTVVDIITLQQWLKDAQTLEQVGGIAYLMTLQDASPSSANLSYYIEKIHEKYLLRKIIHTCTNVVSRVYDFEGEIATLMDEVEREILAINESREQKPEATIKELVKEAISDIEDMHQRQGAIAGISTGLIDLDRQTDGLKGGEMIVVAGYPGSGKTALAMNIAEHVSINQKLSVGVFTLEMPARALVRRFLFSNAKVNGHAIQRGTLTEGDISKLTTSAGRIASAHIHFDDSSDISVFELRAKARRMAQQHGIKFLVIDYLQLLSAVGGGRKVESRQQEVTDISRGIKAIARELEIPVLALSQLNDDGKLRESRAIGQDADGIWILKRDEEADEDGAVILDVAKNRNGPVGAVNLYFHKLFTRFESAAKVSDND